MMFSLGFVAGAMVASIICAVTLGALTVGKIGDLQDRIDELEARQ